jgi:ATP-dependent DNA helicase RecG
MNLPLNLEDFLNARTVESERIEYKSGWNPEPIMQTICAFANDFRDQGGGFVIIGVEAPNGVPVMPPVGLEPEAIDGIHREMIRVSNRIQPPYHPVVEQAIYQERLILVVHCPAGSTRPYKCPVSMTKNANSAYFIRQNSSTIRANREQEMELVQLNQKIPFDDNINRHSTIQDVDLGLIRGFLKKVKSDLFETFVSMSFEDLLLKMNLVEKGADRLYPKNIALMFFNESPHIYFPQCQIDVVHFPDGPGADSFTEKSFMGPLDQMLTQALKYIKNNHLLESVHKEPDAAESQRYFNYPFQALEEALCNAIFHRSYEIREPVEVRVMPDKLTISSFPGPDRAASDEQIKNLDFICRRYRNRRIGEYLKELRLTEGRGTGIPKIIRACQENGSSLPVIHTDHERSFFMMEFPIHQYFRNMDVHVTNHVADHVTDHVTDHVRKLVMIIGNRELSSHEIMQEMGLIHRPSFRALYLSPAIKGELVVMTIPDKPKSINQKYKLSPLGTKLLRGI